MRRGLAIPEQKDAAMITDALLAHIDALPAPDGTSVGWAITRHELGAPII